MRTSVLALALMLTACGDVRSFEQTAEQFQRDRQELQMLAESVLACEGASHFLAVQTGRADCVGDISRDLHRLGYRRAFVDDGRWALTFVNGDQGAPIGSVSSGIVYHRRPGSRQDETPLADAPHHWFYVQRD